MIKPRLFGRGLHLHSIHPGQGLLVLLQSITTWRLVRLLAWWSLHHSAGERCANAAFIGSWAP